MIPLFNFLRFPKRLSMERYLVDRHALKAMLDLADAAMDRQAAKEAYENAKLRGDKRDEGRFSARLQDATTALLRLERGEAA